MSEPKIEVCPVCGVTIQDNARVVFSVGAPGTRAKLWARVCNFAKNPDCINQDESKIGAVQNSDYYA